ncbi:hypothetical protein Plhal703r1_c35g0130531 [Plasmopara halstedii]
MSLTNPLEDIDDELQAMARYYLSPDPIPMVSSEILSQSQNSKQKKQKRNERDRQRSLTKRQSMTQMRQQMKDLEQQKQQLIEHTREHSTKSKKHPLNSMYPSPSTSIKRENFVRLSHEIEAFRRQNAILTEQLRERDLGAGYMQNLLLDFSPDETDNDTHSNSSESDSSSNFYTSTKRKSHLLPRLFNDDSKVYFTPLTREEGIACVRQTLQLVHNAQALYANDVHYNNRLKFFGWGQYTLRQGSTITFSVKKTLKNITPTQLMATTWNLLTDGRRTQKLIPSSVNTHIRPIQKLSDDLFVIDRRSEDSSRSGVSGQKLALRTIYVLFRVLDSDGTRTLAMKTINLPLVKKMLREDEMWCEIFYWIRMSPDGTNDSPSDVATVAEFGGSNTYTRDEIAESWLRELVFLAIRWETLAVAPTLLHF